MLSVWYTPLYCEDKPEDYMQDEDVFDTIGDDILEAMEQKNGKIYD